jgi:N-acetylglucosaminyldiphosphoundecaprenol N-acetyl-beta-D-mannosaminyltransferase
MNSSKILISSTNYETVFGFSVYNSSLDLINLNSGKTELLNTISPNSYGISTRDLEFKDALKKSDYLVLDGVYFALASILLKGKNIKKNQGPDVFFHFMERLNNLGGKVFFLGSSNETLEKIQLRAKIDYPNLSVCTYSPPFSDAFSDIDNWKMCQSVNEFKPNVLFIGMTCPKQEKWAYNNIENVDVSLICCIGAVFDWYAGNQKDIHPLWWKLRLAWLKRTIDRPEILLRYPNIGIFFRDLFLTILRIKRFDNE